MIDLIVYQELELVQCTLRVLIDPHLPNGAVVLKTAFHFFQVFGLDYWFHSILFMLSQYVVLIEGLVSRISNFCTSRHPLLTSVALVCPELAIATQTLKQLN
jgi:hypothetical protein